MNKKLKKEHSVLFSIRTITENDIPRYREILDSVAKERKYLSFFEAPSLEKSYDFVKNNIDGHWPHLVAVLNNKIVGWCDISSLERPIFNHVGVLGVGVLAPHRGLGIGKALICQALQTAKEKKLTRVELTVRANNHPAIELYKKLGFKIEGLHVNAVCVDGVYENLISMAILFKPE